MKASRRPGIEANRIRELKKEYEAKGYKVYLEPASQLLPSFLQSIQVDMYAFNEKEHVLVEVKTHGDNKRSATLTMLSEAIRNKPGWRLELVLTNPKQKPKLGDGILPSSAESHRLKVAHTLAAQGSYAEALILLRAALELVLRRLAKADALDLRAQSLGMIMKNLLSTGALSQSDYNELLSLTNTANMAIHGVSGPPITRSVVAAFEKIVTKLQKKGV